MRTLWFPFTRLTRPTMFPLSPMIYSEGPVRPRTADETFSISLTQEPSGQTIPRGDQEDQRDRKE
jgi:hypothetical protein